MISLKSPFAVLKWQIINLSLGFQVIADYNNSLHFLNIKFMLNEISLEHSDNEKKQFARCSVYVVSICSHRTLCSAK